MIKVGYSPLSETIDTYITQKDKISLAKLKKNISNYPVGTYLRFAAKGNINDISQYTYGKVKTGDNEWKPHSSFFGISQDAKSMTDRDIINFITNKGIKNIAVKLKS